MKLKKILLFTSIAAMVVLGSCSKFNNHLDSLLNNPSTPNPSAASVDLYLNNLELNFKGFYQDASDLTDQLTRQEIMYGPTYFNAFSPSSFDDIWTKAYTSIFLTANTMIPLANDKSEYVHAGIARVLKAYTMITMVDLFGDIPYSQADQGVNNPNPALDKGADVYDSALVILDSAIADFALPASAVPSNDLFYGNGSQESANWATLAKTLQLKIYVQTRLVDNTVAAKISALITAGDLITTSAQDFTFNFSTHNQAPDSRAPHYVTNYGTDAGAGDYIGTYFMWLLDQEKGFVDPRIRYYLYRQIDNIGDPLNGNFVDPRLANQTTTQFAIPCLYRSYPSNFPPTTNPTIGFTSTPYCIVGVGYWGRDHANNEGIPPDNSLRTTWGVYPAGGAFDADQNTATGQSTGRVTGAAGAGMYPIWLSSYTNFLEAEAALILSTPGDPATLLANGINASFNKVSAFPASIGYGLPSDTTMLITPTNQQNYVNFVQSQYTAAATPDAKLNIIMKEYYLAAWGNGVEPYNNYRRTSKPDNMQPALEPNPGAFIRSFFYAAAYADFNKNAVQKTVTNVKVFWDANSDNLF